jgi:hypothetical protein
MGKRGQKPHGNTPLIWSADFAYAIGLIVTDGCLYNDKRHLSFVSKDFELVQTFKDILNIKANISYKKSTSRESLTPHIQFGDVLLYRFLEDIGLSSAKSLTIGEVKIPKLYFFDFVRGCFDGDGSAYVYRDRRWKSSYLVQTSFCSGSIKFLEWIRSRIREDAGIRGHVVSCKKRHFHQLRYGRKESHVLAGRMYYAGVKSYLKRKRLKLNEILGIVGDASSGS